MKPSYYQKRSWLTGLLLMVLAANVSWKTLFDRTESVSLSQYSDVVVGSPNDRMTRRLTVNSQGAAVVLPPGRLFADNDANCQDSSTATQKYIGLCGQKACGGTKSVMVGLMEERKDGEQPRVYMQITECPTAGVVNGQELNGKKIIESCHSTSRAPLDAKYIGAQDLRSFAADRSKIQAQAMLMLETQKFCEQAPEQKGGAAAPGQQGKTEPVKLTPEQIDEKKKKDADDAFAAKEATRKKRECETDLHGDAWSDTDKENDCHAARIATLHSERVPDDKKPGKERARTKAETEKELDAILRRLKPTIKSALMSTDESKSREGKRLAETVRKNLSAVRGDVSNSYQKDVNEILEWEKLGNVARKTEEFKKDKEAVGRELREAYMDYQQRPDLFSMDRYQRALMDHQMLSRRMNGELARDVYEANLGRRYVSGSDYRDIMDPIRTLQRDMVNMTRPDYLRGGFDTDLLGMDREGLLGWRSTTLRGSVRGGRVIPDLVIPRTTPSIFTDYRYTSRPLIDRSPFLGNSMNSRGMFGPTNSRGMLAPGRTN